MSASVPASAIDALSQTSENTEVWWDSSPLIFKGWVEEVLAKEEAQPRREILAAQLARLHSTSRPLDSVIVGVTTNPPLSYQVIQKYPSYWDNWIDQQIKIDPSVSRHDLFWKTYTEIVGRAAAEFAGLFEASGYKLGYISGQVDPRLLDDTDEMVRQGRILNGNARNVMVKMPGTKEGIEGIRHLTALGIPTNATLTFTVSQIISVAEAVKAGLAEAQAKGIDLKMWRSCATMMLGRMEDANEFRRQADSLGIELTPSDLRWAGIAVFKKLYRIFQERGYRTKLLAASMRVGPTVDGRVRVRHVEELAGGNLVMTIFPNIFEAWLENYTADEIASNIDREVPADVVEKLLRIPYFVQAYDEQGLAPEEFYQQPAVIETGTAFAAATQEMEDYVGHRQAMATGRP